MEIIWPCTAVQHVRDKCAGLFSECIHVLSSHHLGILVAGNPVDVAQYHIQCH